MPLRISSAECSATTEPLGRGDFCLVDQMGPEEHLRADTIPGSIFSQSPYPESMLRRRLSAPTVWRRTVGISLALLLLGSAGVTSAEPAEAAGFVGAGVFAGVTPSRLLNTRLAGQGPCLIGSRSLTVADGLAIPSSASAVVLNVTVVTPSAGGYVSVWPAGEIQPTVSNLNYSAKQIIANSVTVKVGLSGAVNLFASGGCPHIVVDIAGYFAGGSPVGAGGFAPLTPSRLLNTRLVDQGPCLTGTRSVKVAGIGAVPADAQAVTLNIAAISASTSGYLSVTPTGSSPAVVSSVNYSAGEVVANSVTARVGANGFVDLRASGGCPHAVVDIGGYYQPGSPVVSGGFTPVDPGRLLNTRTPEQGPCVGSTRTVTVGGLLGIPADAGSAIMNVTAVGAQSSGYLTIYPAGSQRPLASNLNYIAGLATPNAVAVPLGTSGAVTIYASGGCPHVVIDMVGSYSAPINRSPVIGSFASSRATVAAPGLVALSWSVSDPDGEALTCAIDTDGNDTYETTVTNCQNGGSRLGTLATVGTAQPKIRVTDTNSASATRSTSVTVTAGTAEPYNITMRNLTTFSPAVQAAFNSAAATWQSVIARGVPDKSYTFAGGDACGLTAEPAFSGVIDDIFIDISVRPIDGVNGVLAQAGPCSVVYSDALPRFGIMEFDSADLEVLQTNGTLTDVITHEMAHVLGFGTFWTTGRSLISFEGTAQSQFNGALGRAAYSALGRSGNVPLETTGGAGTADSHWSEALFNNELMTGYVDSNNSLSALTIASLGDMGYQVDLTAAEPYSLPSASARAAAKSEPLSNGATW